MSTTTVWSRIAMRRKRLNIAILLCAAASVGAAGARAQLPKVAKKKPGSLSGEVVNAKGAPVADAQILWQAADGETPHLLHSDSQGKFQLESLRTGSYDLRASADGASSEWEHNVLVRPGSVSNVTLRLTVKAVIAAAHLEL